MKKEFAEYLLKKTQRDYNLIADDFSRTRHKTWEEIEFLFDNLEKEDRVLDLGSGNGRFYELLKNTNYTGVDSSERLIEIAREKHPEANFKIADSLSLPFPDNCFDKIYSTAVLHHIPSKEFRVKFLKQARRVLKEKGVLILTVWKFHQTKDFLLLFKYTILKLIGKSKLDFKDIFQSWSNVTDRYYHWFSKGELRQLAQEAGFKVREIGIAKNQKGNRQNIYLIAEK